MPRITAKELRARHEWDVEIEPDWTVHVRRVDFVAAYLADQIPMRLMTALDRLKKQSDVLREDPTNIIGVPQQDKEDTLELLRRYVCLAVVDPIFVMPPKDGEPEDSSPDHVNVTILSSTQLLAIWQSGPSKALPEVSTATADAFRGGVEPEQAPSAVSDEPKVSSTAFDVPARAPGAEIRYH